MTFDIIIKNGTILDGVASEPYPGDVGIVGKEIRAVGNLTGSKAALEISADQKYVSPGFIDAQNHSDSYFTLLEIPAAQSLISQGITTMVVGQCGTSLAPLSTPEAIKSVQKWHSLSGANINWMSFEEFFSVLSQYPLGPNVASLVGHATLRRGLVGDQVRPATPEEIKIMDKLLAESLVAGAAGLSLGLVYAHEASSSQAELAEAARAVGEANKILSVHLRSESGHIVESLTEVIDLAAKSKAALKISHFKIRGKKNWPVFEQALATIDRAYQRGVNLFFDVYPYTTSWTVLYTYLPKWAYEGGRARILENLKNSDTRKKIISYLRDQEQDLGRIFLATSETNPALVGKTLAQVAANQETSVEDALLNVLAATQAQVIVFDHNLSEEVLETLLKHPLSVVASDGAGYDFNYSPAHGLVHPRCFGAFPKFLSMVRDRKIMPWAEAIKKITARPAEKMKLAKRGRLAVGNLADIAVFDPREIGSKASYENPYQQAEGIDYVLISGKVVYSSKEPERFEQAGSVLRI